MLFTADVIEPWILNRFVLSPVTEGYGNMCVYSPYNMHDIQMGNGSLAQLDFLMCDNNRGRVLTEMSGQSCRILLLLNYWIFVKQSKTHRAKGRKASGIHFQSCSASALNFFKYNSLVFFLPFLPFCPKGVSVKSNYSASNGTFFSSIIIHCLPKHCLCNAAK